MAPYSNLQKFYYLKTQKEPAFTKRIGLAQRKRTWLITMGSVDRNNYPIIKIILPCSNCKKRFLIKNPILKKGSSKNVLW